MKKGKKKRKDFEEVDVTRHGVGVGFENVASSFKSKGHKKLGKGLKPIQPPASVEPATTRRCLLEFTIADLQHLIGDLRQLHPESYDPHDSVFTMDASGNVTFKSPAANFFGVSDANPEDVFVMREVQVRQQINIVEEEDPS